MVIQRWQSVLLFFAGLAVCLFAFLPVCQIWINDLDSVVTSLKDALPLFILDLLIGLLLFISIFLYNNLKLQKRVIVISDILLIVLIAATYFYYGAYETSDGNVAYAWNWSVVLPFLALILSIWGYYRVKADENTLKSYDRIR